MARSAPNPSQKKTVIISKKKLATLSVRVTGGSWTKFVVRKRPFLFSS